jgi:hypothetical protein
VTSELLLCFFFGCTCSLLAVSEEWVGKTRRGGDGGGEFDLCGRLGI